MNYSPDFRFTRHSSDRVPNCVYRPYFPTRKQIISHFSSAISEIEKSLLREEQLTKDYTLRSSVLMLCSAFDLFMHEVLYMFLMYMKNHQVNSTEEFRNICNDFEKTEEKIFLERIVKKYRCMTMPNPDIFSEALDYIGYGCKNKMAFLVLSNLKITVLEENAWETLKTKMNIFYKRRNEIAHSFDYALPGGQKAITDNFVHEYKRLLLSITDAVDCLIIDNVKK